MTIQEAEYLMRELGELLPMLGIRVQLSTMENANGAFVLVRYRVHEIDKGVTNGQHHTAGPVSDLSG